MSSPVPQNSERLGTVNEVVKLNRIGTVKYVGRVGTIEFMGTLTQVNITGTVRHVGSIGKVVAVGSVGRVNLLGTLTRVTGLGTLGRVDRVGTIGYIGSARLASGTIGKVVSVGSVGRVNLVGSVTRVTGLGTLARVDKVGTLGYLGSVTRVVYIGRLGSIGAGSITISSRESAGSLIWQNRHIGVGSTYVGSWQPISKYSVKTLVVKSSLGGSLFTITGALGTGVNSLTGTYNALKLGAGTYHTVSFTEALRFVRPIVRTGSFGSGKGTLNLAFLRYA